MRKSPVSMTKQLVSIATLCVPLTFTPALWADGLPTLAPFNKGGRAGISHS